MPISLAGITQAPAFVYKVTLRLRRARHPSECTLWAAQVLARA